MDLALRFESLTKVYGDGEHEVRAVVDASLEVPRGAVVLIMGPSGAGKTTLLSMVGGLLSPSAGRIWIGDTEVTGLGERHLHAIRLRRVGFVFQTFNLLSDLTAVENVRIVIEAAGADRRDADIRAQDVLRELGMVERLHYLPERLSGGEKQRVAIARALANDPDLILADEPTGNLDSRTGYQVMRTLETLVKQRTKAVVCVTHDARILDIADRVLWLEDGVLSDRPASGARRSLSRIQAIDASSSSIDAVSDRMEELGAALVEREDERRHFHAMYLRTTKAVKEDIRAGLFADPEWVEVVEVASANLYLQALERWGAEAHPASPWIVAFEAAKAEVLPPLRHLLLGINAHINYDLPQALIATISDDEFDDEELLRRRLRDHKHIDDILVRCYAEEHGLLRAAEHPGGRRPLDRALTPLKRAAAKRVLGEARNKVWYNARMLSEARRHGPDQLAQLLHQLEVLSAARVADLKAPGPAALKLAVHGFGVVTTPSVVLGTSGQRRTNASKT